MSLTSGTRLGVYDVLAQIGEGGMGQVYRARDTKLNRDVALKVLPEAFAHDADRLARFEREAKTLASLNHPNIAIIHGLEQAGDVHALVMELVEGEDLSQRIARGAIPVDEALPIAKQIADALEAAHEQGVVHRDLKPANIKVRSDGTVKVLDFGLAKAMEPTSALRASAGQALSQAPTITTPAMMTGVGMILGTAAYMSPEQARGQDVDKRADLWAFGVVLWEMLTGTRLFEGATVSDTLAAVLKTEPEWKTLPSATPPALRRLLRRCLEKDRKRRLDSAAAARLDIEEALAAPSAPEGVAASATASTSRGRVAWMVAFAGAAVLAAALALPALRHLRETPPPAPPETRTDIVTPETDDPTSFALSPDGRQIVFVASGEGVPRLWLRPLDTATAQPLAGTENASDPFWSPDSRSVGFFDGTALKRADLAGGSPQTLTTATNRGGTWSADGVLLFTRTTTSPLFRIAASGGEAAAVTTLAKQTSHRFPQFLPGGRRFLFYAQGTPDTQGIYLGSLDAPETTRLTTADAAGVFAPAGPGPADASGEGGWLWFVRGGTLLAQRLDLTRRALTGDPVTVADQIAIDGNSLARAVSVSATGLVAYRSGGSTRRQLTWFDRAGQVLGTVGAPDENGLLNPRLSPDGRRVVVRRRVQGNIDIWLLDADRTTRVTFDPSLDLFPLWSPDGSRIVFDSNRTGRRDLYQKLASGGGSDDLLVASPQDKSASDWSSDGRFLLYHSLDPQTSWDLWVVPLAGDRTPVVWLKTPFDERRAQFSTDGRWVAYQSNESGRFEIHVRPFSGPAAPGAAEGRGGGQWQVSTTGGITPRWGPGGREILYLAPDGTLMAAPIAVRGATLEPGRPVALFRTRIVGVGTDLGVGTNYDIARDGRILINTGLDEATAPITLIQNWTPDTAR